MCLGLGWVEILYMANKFLLPTGTRYHSILDMHTVRNGLRVDHMPMASLSKAGLLSLSEKSVKINMISHGIYIEKENGCFRLYNMT